MAIARRLSGSNAPPPGADQDLRSENDDLILTVHRKTPLKQFIKEYLISTSRTFREPSHPTEVAEQNCRISS